MATRYTDINASSRSALDFAIRHRTPSLTQILIITLIALVVSLSVTATITSPEELTLILFIVLGAFGMYIILQLQRSRDLVMSTEFQNALFASALGINNKFCLIIRRQDGSIVYFDRPFQDLCPDFLKQPRRTVDSLVEYGKIPHEESKKIYAAIGRNVYDKVVFTLRDYKGDSHRIVMSVEPIVRPSGFILLRGREYVQERKTKEGATDDTAVNLNKSTIALFSYVMDSMEMGVYMTGPAGNIIYANSLLERWLGFREGEIASSNFSLQDIIYDNGARTDTIEPGNFEGIMTLRKKNGGWIKGFINQKIIRNDQEKTIGCTALVNNINEQNTDEKKKLW